MSSFNLLLASTTPAQRLPLVWSFSKEMFALEFMEGKKHIAEDTGIPLNFLGYFYVGSLFYALEEEKIVVFYDTREHGERVGTCAKDLFAQGLAKYFDTKTDKERLLREFFTHVEFTQLGMTSPYEVIEEACLNAIRQLDNDKIKKEINEALQPSDAQKPDTSKSHLM